MTNPVFTSLTRHEAHVKTAALQAAGTAAEALANHVMSVFGPSEDDVAMVALRRLA